MGWQFASLKLRISKGSQCSCTGSLGVSPIRTEHHADASQPRRADGSKAAESTKGGCELPDSADVRCVGVVDGAHAAAADNKMSAGMAAGTATASGDDMVTVALLREKDIALLIISQPRMRL